MKLFKKLLSYIIAFTMVLSLATLAGVNVHADNTTQSYTLTIKGTVAGHEYAVYKVLGGTLSGKTLSNVNWGNGVNSSELLSALKDDSAFGEKEANIFYNARVARDVAEALAKKNDESVEAKAFAQDVGQNLGTPVTFGEGENQKNYVKSTAGNTTITLTDPGYYFVKDNKDVTGHDAKTRFIVQVVGPAEVDVKSSVPTVEKKVEDINDSTDTTTTDWQDSADYDIGDDVPYQITGTMPANIADYTSYKYIFTDTMSPGLTYDGTAATETKEAKRGNATIKIDNTDVTSSFAENVTTKDDGSTVVTWTCDNLKGINDPNDSNKKLSITPSTKVVVTYNAVLNTNAKIGATGNPNTVDLTYSNNPNKGGNGETGKTPEDTNIVFTYKTVFNKVDQDENDLAGANFKLEKYINGQWFALVDSKSNDKFNNEAIKSNEGKTFTFKGLDDGIYRLVETTTPGGYNTMKPLEFEITATHKNDGEENPLTLTELKMNKMKTLKDPDNDQTLELKNNADFIPGNTDAGSMSTKVVNKKGSTLPETGGMGTTLLYVAGGILVACAAAYVVLNKKRA